MAKSLEMNGDINTDTSDTVCDNKKNYKGDLATNDGFDLNSHEELAKQENIEISKTGIGTKIGALAQLPIAFFGGKEYDDGRFNPNAQIEAEDLDNALRVPEYAEYTDAPPAPDFKLPEGYTSNIDELLESENAANIAAEDDNVNKGEQ